MTQRATDLINARKNATFLTPPTSEGDFDLSAAYRVADELMRQRTQNNVGQNHEVVGRKIGLTNTAAWDKLGISAPVWGYMYTDTVHYAQDNAIHLSLSGMAAPRLEPEIIFRWHGGKEDLPNNLLDNIEWLALGYEVVDCHYPDWTFKPADAVADFGLHAALIVGQPYVVTQERKEGLENALKTIRVTLYKDDQEVAQGSGADVMGSPLNALEGLLSLLAERSDSLKPGDIVTTGTFTPPTSVQAGESYTAVAEGVGLGPLQVTLT